MAIVGALLLLRGEVMKSREASLRDLAEAAQGIRGDLGHAQRTLAEVNALEQGRARQWEMAADSLRRLEAVVAGSSTRGAAGENILARSLCQLPPDLLETNVAVGNKVVEYALRLPGGRYLPIDSKWTSVSALEALAGRPARGAARACSEQIARDLRVRIREIAKYLDPERTSASACWRCPTRSTARRRRRTATAIARACWSCPTRWPCPTCSRSTGWPLRFGCAVDTDQLAERLRAARRVLRALGERGRESRLSRSLVLLENARDALRDQLAGARRVDRRACSTTRRPSAGRGRGRARRRRRAIDAPPKLALVCTLRLPPGRRCSVMETLAILVAAGRGERMGAAARRPSWPSPAQTLLVRSARALRAAPVGRRHRRRRARRSRSTRRARCSTRRSPSCVRWWRAARGGRIPCEAGLDALPAGFDGIVLVHDAARPFVPAVVVEAVAAAAREHGAAIPAVPADGHHQGSARTHRVTGRSTATGSPRRRRRRRSAATCCRVPTTRRSRTASTVTDESMAVERLGWPVAVRGGLRAQPQDHDAGRPRVGRGVLAAGRASRDALSRRQRLRRAPPGRRARRCVLGGVTVPIRPRPRGTLRRRLRAARAVRRAPGRAGRGRHGPPLPERATRAGRAPTSLVFLDAVARILVRGGCGARERRRDGRRRRRRALAPHAEAMRTAIARALRDAGRVGLGQGEEHRRPGRVRPRRGHRRPSPPSCCVATDERARSRSLRRG